MEKQDPIRFTLDDGVQVAVERTENRVLHFTLQPEDGPARHFSYPEDAPATDEVEAQLDFDQLNALRRYWLEAEKREMS